MALVVDVAAGFVAPPGEEHLAVRAVSGGRYRVVSVLRGEEDELPVDGAFDNQTQALAAAQSFAFSMNVAVIYVEGEG